jgi:hypothetical protein
MWFAMVVVSGFKEEGVCSRVNWGNGRVGIVLNFGFIILFLAVVPFERDLVHFFCELK